MTGPARYRYVGPADVRARVSGPGGFPVRSPTDLDRWAATAEPGEPATFVVGADGILRLAPRRSEHVACAAGGEVLAAGEIAFERTPDRWAVSEVSNQSTGYCPDVVSWAAVAAALDRAGIERPSGYTAEIVFRRCISCGERNVVREADFTCAVCDAPLPREWNF